MFQQNQKMTQVEFKPIPHGIMSINFALLRTKYGTMHTTIHQQFSGWSLKETSGHIVHATHGKIAKSQSHNAVDMSF